MWLQSSEGKKRQEGVRWEEGGKTEAMEVNGKRREREENGRRGTDGGNGEGGASK